MTQKFEPGVAEKLGYYVYIYSDPRSHNVFYVGKGKGTRVFEKAPESSAARRIAELKDLGLEPVREILAFALDEDVAHKVEAAAIDLIGVGNLTNEVRGRDAGSVGRMSIDSVNAALGSSRLERLDHNVIMIKPARLLDSSMLEDTAEARLALYESVRGVWNLDKVFPGGVPPEPSDYPFVFAVYHGVVREVYEVAGWFPAGSTGYFAREVEQSNRWEFVGNVAPRAVRKKYRFADVSDRLKGQPPVRKFSAD